MAGTYKSCGSCGEVRHLKFFPLLQPENPFNADRSDTCNRCDGYAYGKAAQLAAREPEYLAARVRKEMNRTPVEERKRAQSRKRAKRLRDAQPPWANMGKILSFYRKAKRLTEKTGIVHQVDHIIPLQGETVCGLHVETNLRVITKRENVKKRNSFDPNLVLTPLR